MIINTKIRYVYDDSCNRLNQSGTNLEIVRGAMAGHSSSITNSAEFIVVLYK